MLQVQAGCSQLSSLQEQTTGALWDRSKESPIGGGATQPAGRGQTILFEGDTLQMSHGIELSRAGPPGLGKTDHLPLAV